MEPEFLDPGPDQPAPGYPPPGYPPAGHPNYAGPPAPAGQPSTGQRPLPPGFPGPRSPQPARRETFGLLVMLLAAAALPVVAGRQALYTVVEDNVVAHESFTLSAWGDYDVALGPPLAGHGPRFGIVLMLGGVAFALLALLALRLLRGGSVEQGGRVSLGIAAAATGLVGLLVGITAAMTLQIQSAFAGYQEASGVLEVRLRVGVAVWLCLASVLAGGLAVTAALRVRRAFREASSGY